MQKAFSLIELSIVLVILGLLTGGILTGQSLIRASELRTVGTAALRYENAVFTFRDKYTALPGDMLTATRFWGTAPTCPGTSANPASDSSTCNGNGDGQIDGTTPEQFRFWQHLANAGLIEGRYTGVPSSSDASSSQPGSNIPAGRISNTGFAVFWLGYPIGNTWAEYTAPQNDYRNVLQVGTVTSNNRPITPFLKSEEAWNIDVKIDDGKPGTGKIYTFRNNPDCVTNGSETAGATADYNLSTSSTSCNLNAKFF